MMNENGHHRVLTASGVYIPKLNALDGITLSIGWVPEFTSRDPLRLHAVEDRIGYDKALFKSSRCYCGG